MPKRKYPLVTNEVYHVFNRSIAKIPIFTSQSEYQRFMNLISFYRFIDTPMRYSHFSNLPTDEKQKVIKELDEKNNLCVELYAFSIMPNHYHFLLKQICDGGISSFVSKVQNSYAKYFNLKNDRSGSLFQEMFKGIRIEDDNQFVHVARYIHLNPITSYLLKDVTDIKNYPWTSFGYYFGKVEKKGFVSKNFLMSFYKNEKQLEKFTFDQSDYQRRLKDIKHLVFD